MISKTKLGIAAVILSTCLYSNLIVQAEEPGTEEALVKLNKVSNGGFDGNYLSSKTNWAVKGSNYSVIETDEATGNTYGVIKKGTRDEFVMQTIATTPGKVYELEADIYIQADTHPDGVFLTAKQVTGTGNQGPVLHQMTFDTNTEGWVKQKFQFTAQTAQSMVGIVKWAESGTDAQTTEIRIDNVSVTELEEYEFIWGDDFTGDTLDQTFWGYELGNIRGNEQQHYTSSKDNVFLRDDNLVLKVTDRAAEDQYQNPRFGANGRNIIYNSGSVRTHGKQEFLYGRIETRAKLPKGKGAFPAFWTLGADFVLDGDVNAKQGYGWPSTGEIDIMEIIGGPTDERAGEETAEGDQSNKIAYGTPHFYYVNGDSDKDGSYSPYTLGGNLTLSEDFYDEYHVFGINWSPDKIEWYVDGVVYNTMPLTGDARLEAAAKGFNRPQYIQFNLATGGNWAKNAGTHLAEDDTEFVIDYVHLYQSAEQKAAQEAYYADQPVLSGIQDIVMTEGETPNLLDSVSVDLANYTVDFSVEDEYMFENTGGNTNVTLKSSGVNDSGKLAKLSAGVYNIHYSGVPEGVNLVGTISPDHKVARKSAKLVVLPKGGLDGKVGEKLSSIKLPEGWQWQAADQIIELDQNYQVSFKNVKNTGTAEGNERTIQLQLSGEDITRTVEVPEPEVVNIHVENLTLDGTKEVAEKASEKLQKELNSIMELGQGTLSFRYRLDSADASVRSSITSLLSVSNKAANQEYAAFYIRPATNKIGVEFRGKMADVSVGSGFNFISNSDWQTVTYRFDGGVMTVYLNGVEFGKTNVSDLFSDISWKDHADTITIGGLRRIGNGANAGEEFQWGFKGLMSDVVIDEQVLNADEIKTLHEQTARNVIGEKYALWDKYDEDIFEYRIPSIVKTKDGTLVAASDARKKHYNDWGDIATVVRTSKDNGKTWSQNKVVLDMPTQPYYTNDYSTEDWNTKHTQSAFSIDPILLTDSNGKLYMLVDVFPESQGAVNSKNGSGHEVIDGKSYLNLYDFNNKKYTIREEGIVYDSDGKATDMYVSEGEFATAFSTKGDLYRKEATGNDTRLGNIYLRSGRDKTGITKEGSDTAPLFTYMTGFLWLMTSDDQGETWSNPVDVTDVAKEDWMGFAGTGAAPGIEISIADQEGKPAKRLIFPIYYTNQKGGAATGGLGRQSSANLYSDDGGVTWQRSESPNDGRVYGDGQQTTSKDFDTEVTELTENQIVQLNNGHLLQFMRNTGKNVAIARSTDYGVTWDNEVLDSDVPDPYVNLSAIHVNLDGKEYIVLSNPVGHPDGEVIQTRNSRMKGALRVGEVKEDDSIEWISSQIVEPKRFAYSSLAQLDDENVGMLYENDGHIKYSTFNIKEMITKQERFDVATVTGVETKVINAEGAGNSIKAGDKLQFDVQLSQPMFIVGERKLEMKIGDVVREASYQSGSGTNKLSFEYTVSDVDTGAISITSQFPQTTLETIYGITLSNREATFDGGIVGAAVDSTLTLNVSSLEILKKGKTLATNPSVTPNPEKIKWTIADEKIASVDEAGVITGLKAGTTRITAEISNGSQKSFVLRVTQ